MYFFFFLFRSAVDHPADLELSFLTASEVSEGADGGGGLEGGRGVRGEPGGGAEEVVDLEVGEWWGTRGLVLEVWEGDEGGGLGELFFGVWDLEGEGGLAAVEDGEGGVVGLGGCCRGSLFPSVVSVPVLASFKVVSVPVLASFISSTAMPVMSVCVPWLTLVATLSAWTDMSLVLVSDWTDIALVLVAFVVFTTEAQLLPFPFAFCPAVDPPGEDRGAWSLPFFTLSLASKKEIFSAVFTFWISSSSLYAGQSLDEEAWLPLQLTHRGAVLHAVPLWAFSAQVPHFSSPVHLFCV